MIISDLCIRRPVFATMLVGAFVVVGWFCYGRLGIDLMPRIEIPTLTITTTLVGAGPEEIETRITKPIEEVVNTISGIDELRSTTVEGLSRVVVIFETERDLDSAAQDVRDKVGTILADLPEGTEPPIIDKFDVDATPILFVTVTGSLELKELTELTKKRVKEPLESILGVGAIRMLGGRQREIQIAVDAAKLEAHGLSIQDVARAVGTQNVELPGGRLAAGPQETSVRILGRVERAVDLLEIQVANIDGRPIRIRDVASVIDGAEEARSVSRYNGLNAVTLSVRKQTGANTVAVVDALLERVHALETALPQGLRLQITRDQSKFIRSAVHEVQSHMIFGAVLASVVVLLFMRSWSATVIAAVAIPTSVIATFGVMYAAGFSLNRVTLLALTLAVGIVIDDAIVVLENIWRFLEEKGLERFEAARQATAEVGLAVTATTVSLAVVFVPVAFIPGVIGGFLKSFGLTMAFSIMVSLMIAFTLTPTLAARMLAPRKQGHGSRETGLYAPLERGYLRLVRWSMAHRWAVVMASIACVLAIPTLGRLAGGGFMPEDDRGEFDINLRLPQGSSLDRADQLMLEIEDALRPIPEIRGLLTLIGEEGSDDVTRAQISVVLAPLDGRQREQFAVMQEVRERLAPFRSLLRVSVDNPPPMSGSGVGSSEIAINLRGPDAEALERAGADLREIMARHPGVVDLDSSSVPGKPEVQLAIERDRASDLGISVADLASTVRMLLAGEIVTQYKEEGELYDVRVRLAPEDRMRPDVLARLTVPSSRGQRIRLDNLVSFRTGTGPSQITRQSRERQITFYANVATGHAFGDVLDAIMADARRIQLPSTMTLDVSGRGKLYGETVAGFRTALLLSLVFMYIVLAAQFESFLHPVTIMLSLPLAVPFALLSLWLAGSTLNLFSGLGILLLFGIVKKNSILQIDHMLNLQRAGVPRLEAILEANRDRLRPILMTTISLVVAMMPAAFARGEGAEVTRSIAVVVVGGQSLCLLVTLLLTPVAYSLFDDLGERLRNARVPWRPQPSPEPVNENETVGLGI